MASMEPCMVRRMVAHFGQTGILTWRVDHNMLRIVGYDGKQGFSAP